MWENVNSSSSNTNAALCHLKMILMSQQLIGFDESRKQHKHNVSLTKWDETKWDVL